MLDAGPAQVLPLGGDGTHRCRYRSPRGPLKSSGSRYKVRPGSHNPNGSLFERGIQSPCFGTLSTSSSHQPMKPAVRADSPCGCPCAIACTASRLGVAAKPRTSAARGLFRGHAAARAGTSLELSLALPALNAEERPEMICRGVIVRSAGTADGTSPGLAVRIQHSRLTRG